jgi:hypothetical protein
VADYGVFRTNDAKRIAAATRRVEGSPRTYVHVPQRVPNRGAGGGGRTPGDPAFGSPWTIAEYDAPSGAVVKTYYRGRNRAVVGGILFDQAIIWHSGGYLIAGGTGDINADSGCIVRWDVDSGEKQWESDDNGGTATVFGTSVGTPATNKCKQLVEASDGYIWACQSNGGSGHVTRTNPTTGVQTHSYNAQFMQVFPADSNGGVVLHQASGSPYLRVLDNTATSTATYTTVTTRVSENNGILCCCASSSDLTLLNADDLTTIDSLAAPSGIWLGCVSDGTHVYGAYTSNYIKLDATNLAAAAIWTNTKSTDLTMNLFMHEGRLYDCHYQTANNALGGIAKINTSDGSVTWNYTTSGRVQSDSHTIAFGSDFVVFTTVGAGIYDIICLDDSTGAMRWRDTWQEARGVVVTDDDRVFICGQRINP